MRVARPLRHPVHATLGPMRYLPPTLLLLLTVGLAYLSRSDRMSPQALTVLELEGQLGFPVFVPVLLVALVALGLTLKGDLARRGSAKAVRAPTTRPVAGTTTGAGWQRSVSRQVDDTFFEDGVQLVETGRASDPYVLRVERVSHERSRRAIFQFAEMVAGMPTPPRVRVSYGAADELGAPRHHLVAGAFAKFFDRTSFRVLRTGGDVDVVFSDPDKRWRS